MTPQLSLVIPVYNEAGNIEPLLASAVDVLIGLRREFEIIVVNDGSTDGSGAEIASFAARWPQCTELRLPQNRGQAVALLAGLHAARGELLVTMDGDGQNDPRDIPDLLDLLESEGLDLACGWRVDRHDDQLRRVMSRLANSVRRGVLDDGVHDAGCQLRVFRRTVLSALYPMELMQSFIPSLAAGAGFTIGERPVRHHPRHRGDSKYSLQRLWWRPAVAMLALRWRLWRRTRP